jgi:hypothetical protein
MTTITERARYFAENCPRGEHTDFFLGKTRIAQAYRYSADALPNRYLISWPKAGTEFWDNVGVDGVEAATKVLIALAALSIESRLDELLQEAHGVNTETVVYALYGSVENGGEYVHRFLQTTAGDGSAPFAVVEYTATGVYGPLFEDEPVDPASLDFPPYDTAARAWVASQTWLPYGTLGS